MARKLTAAEFELLKKAGYPEKAIEYYQNKLNVDTIDDSDITLSYTGPCGDTMRLYLKINDDRIVDAKFLYLGCPGAASSGSAMTMIVRGKTLEEAKKFTEDDVLRELGGLPDTKLHCTKLTITTLRKTVTKYEKETRR